MNRAMFPSQSSVAAARRDSRIAFYGPFAAALVLLVTIFTPGILPPVTIPPIPGTATVATHQNITKNDMVVVSPAAASNRTNISAESTFNSEYSVAYKDTEQESLFAQQLRVLPAFEPYSDPLLPETTGSSATFTEQNPVKDMTNENSLAAANEMPEELPSEASSTVMLSNSIPASLVVSTENKATTEHSIATEPVDYYPHLPDMSLDNKIGLLPVTEAGRTDGSDDIDSWGQLALSLADYDGPLLTLDSPPTNSIGVDVGGRLDRPDTFQRPSLPPVRLVRPIQRAGLLPPPIRALVP